MATAARLGAGHQRALRIGGGLKPRSKIVGKERTIDRYAEQSAGWRVLCEPVEARKNPGERSGKTGNGVADHGQAKRGEPLQFAVRIDNNTVALWAEAVDRAMHEVATVERQKRLVAPAHP